MDELARELKVSAITVRRDLAFLEKRGLLERTHGGALSTRLNPTETSYADKDERNRPVKEKIARRAATLIEEKETLFVGSGSTTALVIRELLSIKGLTLITNNVAALGTLGAPGEGEIILPGGTLRPGTGCVVGEDTLKRLGECYAGTTIIGLDGISLRWGLTSHNTHEARVSQKMVDQTLRRVIAVADSTKIGAIAPHWVVPLSALSILITDTLPVPSIQKDFEEAGVEVLLCAE